jgi:hypothetical protein
MRSHSPGLFDCRSTREPSGPGKQRIRVPWWLRREVPALTARRRLRMPLLPLACPVGLRVDLGALTAGVAAHPRAVVRADCEGAVGVRLENEALPFGGGVGLDVDDGVAAGVRADDGAVVRAQIDGTAEEVLEAEVRGVAVLLVVVVVVLLLLRRIASLLRWVTTLLRRIPLLLRRITTLLWRVALLLRRVTTLLRRVATLLRRITTLLGVSLLLGRIAGLLRVALLLPVGNPPPAAGLAGGDRSRRRSPGCAARRCPCTVAAAPTCRPHGRAPGQRWRSGTHRGNRPRRGSCPTP